MKRFYKKWMMCGCLLAAMLLAAQLGFTQNSGVIAKSVLDGGQHQIQVDSFRTVQDSAFFNPSFAGSIDTNYRVQNVITCKINEASPYYIKSAFTVTLHVRIIYTTGASAVDSIEKDFTVNYDSAHTYNSRSSFVFGGAHQVVMKVLTVTSNVSSWDATTVLLLENQLTANPDFAFTCSNTVGSITVTPSVDPAADELPISWTAVVGADQYDLEWTYIDSSALANHKYGNPVNPAILFLNNSTRVSTTGNTYSIPLIYDNSGSLFIRVRPVQITAVNAVKAAIWSSDASPSVLGEYDYTGHERPLNWQSSISFAEEGKRKVVLQYFDGALRGRQTVTKDNTTNTTIVAETYYDYQGRPVVQVMPSPTLSNIIQYTAGFNTGVNGSEYSQSNYDSLTNPGLYCSVHADSMTNASGASLYYSPHNPSRFSGMNQFIPDAKDFPFTETEYTQDNTGRISRQGGVGPDHQLGSDHETKYYYGNADQNMLDGLFGTEVGNQSHYFKNMVRDANGQYSVSYIDMHGRTIATALAGGSPSSLATLASNSNRNITENMNDSGSVYFQDQSVVSKRSLLVPLAGNYYFNYNLNPASLSIANCSSTNICYTCLYDLEITVTDNCNNQLLPGNHAFDTVLHNFTLGSFPVTCPASPNPLSLNFTLNLPEGNYEVTKKLTVNNDAYLYYRDSVYLPNNTCVSLASYINTQKTLASLSNPSCAPTCGACIDSVGSWAQFWSKYITQSGIALTDTTLYKPDAQTAYQNALASCSALCKDSASSDDDIRKAMLQDVTPPFGQYADTLKGLTDNYSIFFAPKDQDSYVPVFKLPAISYLDQSGNPDIVYNQQSDLNVAPNSLTQTQFVQNFRNSWAEALLPYHPEYCKLLALENLRPSNQWDRRMEAIDNYQDAHDQGFLNPTANGSAPFSRYPIVTGNKDPICTQSGATAFLESYLQVGLKAADVNPNLSLWALACISAKCKSGDHACITFYATATNDFDPAAMCTGDLDMAWKTFRQLYLSHKQAFVTKLVSNPTGCSIANNRQYTSTPTDAVIFKAHHQPEFNDPVTSINNTGLKDILSGGNGPSYATNAQAEAQNTVSANYDATCAAMAQQWASQLSTCNYSSSALQDSILPRLTALCRLACDNEHPMGASTLPGGVTYTPTGTIYHFTCFQDIINTYNQLHGITDALHCNAEMITSPQPYNNAAIYSAKPVYSKPSDCECSAINDLYNTYVYSHQGDASFSGFLKRTQQITMSDIDLNNLKSLCSIGGATASGCTNLSKPINLPPAMQCYAGTTCAPCSQISSLYTAFQSQYPGVTPVVNADIDTTQQQKNVLFQNFMNNRLGFSKQAVEYLNFMDSCSVSTITDTAHCVKTVGHIYLPGGTDVMSDIRSTPDSGYIMAGNRIAGGGSDKDAYIFKTNKAGAVLWAKTYGGTGDDDFARVRVTADKGFIAVGNTKSAGAPKGQMLVVKFDSTGALSWSKAIGFGSFAGESGADIIQTTDGQYVALGAYNNSPGFSNMFVTRLDATGASLWAHEYGTLSSDIPVALTSYADTVFMTCANYQPGTSSYWGTIYKIRLNDGVVLQDWEYRDGRSGYSLYFNEMRRATNNWMISVTSSLSYLTDSTKLSWATLDLSGNFQSAYKFNIPGADLRILSGSILPTDDGGYVVTEGGDVTQHLIVQKRNADNSLAWGNKIILPATQTVGREVQNADGTYTVLGTDASRAMRMDFQANGQATCYNSNVIPDMVFHTFNSVSDVPFDSLKTASVTNASLTLTSLSISDSSLYCYDSGSCLHVYKGPILCGKAAPVFPVAAVDSVTNCSDSTFFSITKGTVLFNAQSDSLSGDFEQRYKPTCLQAYRYETFTVTHAQNEYHYTLYYYDQAGNLVKTVAPAGVDQHTDSLWLASVRAARLTNTAVVPSHTLTTNYRYNTLNQVATQRSPDAGGSRFWYDRLGRLVVSQNAKQSLANNYSYTQYDSIGRITEVGELASTTAITNVISRSQGSLMTWQSNAASTLEQITHTSYDYVYSPLEPEMAAQNLRNRVSWTALYNTASDLTGNNPATATYYSYDILGNVDTLVQDYKIGVMADNGNRFKKIVYQYDLVSGKVNQIAYQHGQPDAFYHSYLYDAENRITNVLTSRDSINWDNDAYYSYYAHGPLAQTIIGEQQVQGQNYVYNLQGWLKAINPNIYHGTGYTLSTDGSSGSIVGANAYNLLLNYYNGDFSPVSGVAGPDSAVNTTLTTDYRPLFNGNISSMGVNIAALSHPLLYNYHYDQLNRLVGMDAWNRTSTPWSAITKLSDFKENISYDPNGNIQTYKRQGNNTFASQPLSMDDMTYNYKSGTNQLDHISDAVSSSNYSTDIDNQSSGNYSYDSIGNMISDNAEGITAISWTVYGKIASMSKSDGTTISYTYDASGNRISKKVVNGASTIITWYTRDAQGNALSVYTSGNDSINTGNLSQTEVDLYGITRVGLLQSRINVQHLDTIQYTGLSLLGSGNDIIFTRGNKLFELTNHLGNVLSTLSDKKFGHTVDNSTTSNFTADVISANDYYSFGSIQPGRSYAQVLGGNYRYGFNGQENSDDIADGLGKHTTAQFWEYDTRTGRRWNTDPKPNASISDYASLSNNPIFNIDVKGDTTYRFNKSNGKYLGMFDKDEAGQTGSYGSLKTIGKGKNKQEVWDGQRFEFADPTNDAQDIRTGVINRLIFVSNDDIKNMLTSQGGFKYNDKNNFWAFYQNSLGGHNFDYSYSLIPSIYGDQGASKSPLDKPSSVLFLPEGDNTAHNHMNFGNYLWGASGYTLGFNFATLQLAAHANSLINFRSNNYSPQFDSPDDQNSIKKGAFHALQYKYRTILELRHQAENIKVK